MIIKQRMRGKRCLTRETKLQVDRQSQCLVNIPAHNRMQTGQRTAAMLIGKDAFVRDKVFLQRTDSALSKTQGSFQ
jgi:hypothetical protein